jgi:acetone carboxylase gamma subunit
MNEKNIEVKVNDTDNDLKSIGEAMEEVDVAKIREAESRLLPCPFCGSKASINYVPPHTHVFVDFMPDYKGEHFIERNGCTCAICGGPELEDAIDVWNRRVEKGT